uniref:Defensin beta 115 n=1 Tax=Suricata suricatta TaxID=37032 RepID=A0A673UH20_SURSU
VLLDRSSPLSGYIKLLFLALPVFVLLAQASPNGWVKRCSYRIGRCRRSCKENEKKKEKCGKKICCIPNGKRISLNPYEKPQTSLRQEQLNIH